MEWVFKWQIRDHNCFFFLPWPSILYLFIIFYICRIFFIIYTCFPFIYTFTINTFLFINFLFVHFWLCRILVLRVCRRVCPHMVRRPGVKPLPLHLGVLTTGPPENPLWTFFKRFMNLHVILAQGPCSSSLYRFSFSVSAALTSTLQTFLNMQKSGNIFTLHMCIHST